LSRPGEAASGPASRPNPARQLCLYPPESVQSIFDALPESVIVVDAQLRILSINAAAAALFGLEAAALGGRPVCELFPENDCPRDCLRETVATGRPIVDYQTALRLPGGVPAQILIRTVPLGPAAGEGTCGEAGQPGQTGGAGAVIILRDVTEETSLRKEVAARQGFGGIVGKSARLRELYGLIENVAPSSATVLIRGETGTGKELVARALHFASGRSDGPFVQVNCSALSEGLLESELFGHVKGAFTGAVADRRGRFEEASGGTIFLDEIGDVSPVVQVKLLRVLQERVVERVGESRPRPVDVRVISATHRDLEALRAVGRIREDFYYRIRVVTLELPPLRERREDVPLLAAHFLARLRGAPATGAAALAAAVPPETMRLLLEYPWPGNVRELENALEHAHVLSRGRALRPEHLPPEVRAAAGRADALRDAPKHSPTERELIAAALGRAGWNRSRAARQLGIDRTTLWRKIREYGLRPAEEP
jgi:transcriptional regulator with PAS, ATPase and Fis domain